MPEISLVFGITRRGTSTRDTAVIIEIQTLQVLGGRLGPRVMGLVIEWALQHRDDLLEDWRLASESAPLNRIAPLE